MTTLDVLKITTTTIVQSQNHVSNTPEQVLSHVYTVIHHSCKLCIGMPLYSSYVLFAASKKASCTTCLC